MWQPKNWCKTLMIIFILLWFAILFYAIDPLLKGDNENQDFLHEELKQANHEIQVLKEKNKELEIILSNIKDKFKTHRKDKKFHNSLESHNSKINNITFQYVTENSEVKFGKYNYPACNQHLAVVLQ